MEMTVFHGTCSIHRESIETGGLDPGKTKPRDDHWLGQGVYFFDEIRKARWWANIISTQNASSSALIYQARIEAPDNRVLNLDDARQMDIEEMINCVRQPIKDGRQKQPVLSLDKARAVFLDYYKQTHDIVVIIATFEKECAEYTAHRSRSEMEIQKELMRILKIKYHERQICVSDKAVIRNTRLYYDEEEEIL